MLCDGNIDDENDDDKLDIKNLRPGEPNRTRHREVYGVACFFGGVASPVSIKACSLHALDQLLNSTSHMPCFMGSVNRRNS